MPEQLNRNHIVACYRSILGREPESEDVIQSHLNSGVTLEAFMHAVLNSPEYLKKTNENPFHVKNSQNFSFVSDIEVSGTEKQMQSLLDHMRTVWTKYGEDDPYFSVLTNEIFRKSTIDEKAIEQFFQAGLNDFGFINRVMSRNDLSIEGDRVVLDFGCGLGRVGSHFALSCEKYIGVDISRAHINQAKVHFDRIGIVNYEFMLLEEFLGSEDIADFIFSVIVLQHNPPPVISYLIRQICRALRPGGKLVFQVPTSLEGYKFDLKQYLANLPSHGIMEMHAFPQKEVFNIFDQQGLQPVEVFEHDMIGPIGESTVFVAVKRDV
jgi:SAM-dependent methyltransferase